MRDLPVRRTVGRNDGRSKDPLYLEGSYDGGRYLLVSLRIGAYRMYSG